MAISKIILNGVTQMDVTGKTVTANTMLNGTTALKNDGTDVTGNIANMTLPSAASSTSSGTAKATITPGSTAQYINIPTGYNSTAQYYTVSASSGSSKNIQVDNTNHRIATTTYTDTGAEITVAVAGTYDIYWSAFRSSTSSGTNGTQWYKNDVAQGSAYTSWSNSYCQTIKVSGVVLAKNDVIKIYARASSNSRYVCVGNLTIVQTA